MIYVPRSEYGYCKSSMKILHYIPTYAPAWGYGGPVRSVSNLCEGMVELGHEVTVFTSNAGLSGTDAVVPDRLVKRNGVDVYYFEAKQGVLGLNSEGMKQAVASRVTEFDIVHVTGVWQPTSIAACRAARKARKPYICSPRGALGRYSFTQKPWKKWPYYLFRERRNLIGAAALHFTAKMEELECRRLGLRVPGFIVPNSIDFSAWRRDEAGGVAWREKHGIKPNEVLFLYAGRMHHKKGLDLLPAAFAGLVTDRPWKLCLIGFDEDGTGARLKTEFGAMGWSDRLILSDGVEARDLSSIYSAASAFVFPSRHENFGNVVIEALACGCAVLSSDQVGAAFELEHVSGVTVLPREIPRWTEALMGVIVGRGSAISSREIVESKFSQKAVAQGMIENYQEILRYAK